MGSRDSGVSQISSFWIWHVKLEECLEGVHDLCRRAGHRLCLARRGASVWISDSAVLGSNFVFAVLFEKSWVTAGYMDDMRKGFSFVVVILSVIGLTVHYWDSVWIFFSLSLGVRASFAEFESGSVKSPARTLQRQSRPAPLRRVGSSSRNPLFKV